MVGQLEHEIDVVLAVRIGLARAVQADQAQYGVPRGERGRDEGTGPRRADRLRAVRIREEPRQVLVQRDRAGPQVGNGLGVGRGRGQGAYVAQRMRLRLVGPAAAAERGAPHGDVRRKRSERRVVAAQYGVHHFDDRDVGHPRHQDVHELLAGGHHVERSPHPLADEPQDLDAGPLPLPVGDVDHGHRNTEHHPGRRFEAEGGHLVEVLLARFRPAVSP